MCVLYICRTLGLFCISATCCQTSPFRACSVTFFGQVKLAQVGGQKSHPVTHGPPSGGSLIQADVRQVGGLGSRTSSPYLARWSPHASRNCTAKSRIDCAILARIASLNSALHFRGGTAQLRVRFLTKYRHHVTCLPLKMKP